MKAAIRDARKAFSPAASENARQTSDRMLAQVPNNSQVRERLWSGARTVREKSGRKHYALQSPASVNLFHPPRTY